MTEVTAPDASTAAIPYTKGISSEVATRGSVARFLPGSLLALGLAFFLDFPASAGEWMEAAIILGFGAGALTSGYRVGLELIRRRLYPDAQVDGRRSFIAGLMSPLGAFAAVAIAAGIFASQVGGIGVLLLSGIVLAVLMFFAWLTPTPEDSRPARYALDKEASGLD